MEYFDSDYIPNLIESTKEMIAEYVEKDPTKFCTYDEFESGVTALKEFCTLRAESISGQLNGTIPSTSDGQTADSSSLIMAEGLNISDMGTMNNGGGSPDGKAQSNTAQTKSAADNTDNTDSTNNKSFSQTSPNNSESSSDGTDNSTSSDGSVPTGGFGGTPPDMSDSNGSGPPSMPNGEMPSIPDGDTQGDSQNNNPSEKDGNGQNEKAPPQSGEASGETAQTLDKNSIIVLAACAGVLILGVALAFVYRKKS